MDFKTLLENPLNNTIIGLLVVSNLTPRAKRAWIDLLVHMTDDEKNRLKGILEDEVKYEIKVTEEAREKFIQEMERVAAEAE